MKDLKIEPMKLIVSIVERGQGRNMIELFNGQRLTHHLQCAGKGTATSEIRDLLGLDGVEKDVIFTVGRGTMVNRVMRDLNNELRGAARSRGIVFDMKLTAMAHVTALAIQMNVQNEVGRVDTMTEEGMENSMILVTVNQGFTEEVMETARKAGARGGTIIHARWAGSESVGTAGEGGYRDCFICCEAQGNHGGNQQKPWHENRGARDGLLACD